MAFFIGITLLSAAMILLELTLLRLFAIQQFYHFAFMAISLALLGAGASGSLLTVRGRKFSPNNLSLFFSLTTLGTYLVINYLPFDSYSIAWDNRQILYLFIYFTVVAFPFFFAGLLVGGELMATGHKQGRAATHHVYAANLIGSAVGSLASLLVLNALGSVGAVFVVVIAGGLSAFVFSLSKHPMDKRNLSLAGALAVVATGLGLLAFRPGILDLQLSPYKTLPILSHTLDANHLLSVENATARVDVVESSTIHVMPGLSLQAPTTLPDQAGLMLDGDNLMPVSSLDPDSEQARLLSAYRPEGISSILRPEAETLVIGAGTGTEVLFSLAGGSNRITAVEENGLIIDTIQEILPDQSRYMVDDPRVQNIEQSGRVFARRSVDEEFDVIILALTDPHRPVTSGAYSLTEDYSYTVEAFADYMNALAGDGILIVTRWLQTPPSESARTFGALVEALNSRDIDPEKHLIAFRTIRTMTIVAGRKAFSPEEINRVQSFLATRGFDGVYWPGIQGVDLNQFNLLPEADYHNLFTAILENPKKVYEEYRFDIRPALDDRPFFFHYFKWRQTPEILASLGLTWQPFGGSGYFVLVALLILVALAAALFIIGPLLLLRYRKDKQPHTKKSTSISQIRVLGYFAFLGLAFLFVEIPLAQRFILVLDHPVTALAVVIFTILFFSGLGSLTVPRWPMRLGFVLLLCILALYPFLLEPISNQILGLSEGARIILTITTLAPLGYFMGLPFAGGLKVVEAQDARLVPWAWAINGSFSVISSVLAVMLALSLGFSVVLWLGAVAYLGAVVVLWQYWGK